jgi:hypothetical protein
MKNFSNPNLTIGKWYKKQPVNSLFSNFIFYLSVIVTSVSYAQTSPPNVEWRRFDWAREIPQFNDYPSLPYPSSSNRNMVMMEESGEDWWYWHNNSYDLANNQDGYIACGYTSYTNYMMTEKDDGLNVKSPNLTLGNYLNNCDDEFQTNTSFKGSFFQSIGKVSKNGLRLEWLKAFIGGSNYRVIQTSDGGYVAVGETYSSRYAQNNNGVEELSGKLIYNRNANGTTVNDYLTFSNYGQHVAKDHRWHASVTKVDNLGNLVWVGIYGLDNFQNVLDSNLQSTAWDVQEIGGKLFVVGEAEELVDISATYKKKVKHGLLWEIDGANGCLIQKVKLSTSNNLVGNSNPNNVNSNINYSSVRKLLINGNSIVIAGVEGVSSYAGTNFQRIFIAKIDNLMANGTIANISPTFNAVYRQDNQLVTSPDVNVSSAFAGTNQQAIYDMVWLQNKTQFVAGVIKECLSCAFANYENSGTGNLIRFDYASNLQTPLSITNIGNVNAFDLKIGLTVTKDITTGQENGFAAISSKTVLPVTRNPKLCNGVNVSSARLAYDADAFFVKCDLLGNIIWQETYASENIQTLPEYYPGNYKKQECMYSITQADDGSLVGAGNCSHNFDDNYLIKLYPENCSNAITNYDIIPNNYNGIQDFSYPAYVIDGAVFTGGFSNRTIVWNNSKKIKGSVVIKAGYQLIISGANTIISFDDSKQTGAPSKLIVMPGAKLRVENGAKITCYGNCKPGMWDGIEVWGSELQEQDILNNAVIDINYQHETLSTNQGLVILSSGGSIENALIGITASHSANIENQSYGNYLTGGIIQASDFSFINNHIDAEVLHYHSLDQNFNENPNKSTFTNCTFVNSEILADPTAGMSEIFSNYSSREFNESHLHIWNINGVVVNSCKFKTDFTDVNGLKPTHSKGIEAFDATFKVTGSGSYGDTNYYPSTFENLEFGILNGSYNGSCDPEQYNTLNSAICNINRSSFKNCMRGIELDGTILSKVNRCQFDMTDEYGGDMNNSNFWNDYNNGMQNIGEKPKMPVAIYTNAAISFEIKDNRIENNMSNQLVSTYGMVNTNASAFDPANTLKNYYKQNYVQQQFELINLQLNSNCNTFDNKSQQHFSWVVFDQLKSQGECNSIISSAETNLFIHPSSIMSPDKDIHLDFYANPFEYNSNPNFVPIYHNNTTGNVIGCSGNYPIDISDACLQSTYLDKFAAIETHLGIYNSLLASYESVKDLLDGGNTEQMLNYIQNHNLQWLNQVPVEDRKLLSDEVLLSIIDHLDGSNWLIFDSIFTSNSPINVRIMDLIYSKPDIPNPIKQHLLGLQNGISPRSVIDDELRNIENELGLALNDIVVDYIEEGQPTEAMSFIRKTPIIGAKMLGIALDPFSHFNYSYAEDLATSISLLQRISNNEKAIEQLTNFRNYYVNILPICWQINHGNSDNISNLYYSASVSTIDGMYSSIVLAANKKSKYGYNPQRPRFINGYKVAQQNENIGQTPNEAELISNQIAYPNPVNDFLHINLMANSENIVISDLSGKIVLQKTISDNEGINVSMLNNGCYFLKMNNKTKPFKFIIQH